MLSEAEQGRARRKTFLRAYPRARLFIFSKNENNRIAYCTMINCKERTHVVAEFVELITKHADENMLGETPL
jgi:hypothetical protein